jgi:hypothetical protein
LAGCSKTKALVPRQNAHDKIMISNERPSPYGHRASGHISSKQSVAEETLKIEKVQIERKTFVFMLKENPRGRFLRITEDVNGRRDAIIIPASGLEEFKRVIAEMTRVSIEMPMDSNL